MKRKWRRPTLTLHLCHPSPVRYRCSDAEDARGAGVHDQHGWRADANAEREGECERGGLMDAPV